MTETLLYEELRKRYALPAYAILPGVANGTGGAKARTADALVMSLWPSRGLHLHGFEIKCDRRDWQKELADPAKAEAVARFCDFWWIVTPDEKVALPSELPSTWGLLVMGPKGLKVVKEAPLLTPEPMLRPFLAAVLRRAQEHQPGVQELAAAREAGRTEGYKNGYDVGLQRGKGEVMTLQQRAEVLAAFEEAAGQSLSYVERSRKVGERVKVVLACDAVVEQVRREAQHCHNRFERLMKELDAAMVEPPVAVPVEEHDQA